MCWQIIIELYLFVGLCMIITYGLLDISYSIILGVFYIYFRKKRRKNKYIRKFRRTLDITQGVVCRVFLFYVVWPLYGPVLLRDFYYYSKRKSQKRRRNTKKE